MHYEPHRIVAYLLTKQAVIFQFNDMRYRNSTLYETEFGNVVRIYEAFQKQGFTIGNDCTFKVPR